MGVTTLATTTSEKDLGVYVDTELTFEKHLETVVNQANRMLVLIRRSYIYLDSQSLLKLYTSCSIYRYVNKYNLPLTVLLHANWYTPFHGARN